MTSTVVSDWQLVAMGVIGGSALTFFVGLVVALALSDGMQEEETDASGN